MVPTLRLRARQERLRAVVKEVSESRRRVILVVDEVRGAAETAQRIESDGCGKFGKLGSNFDMETAIL